MGIQASIQNPVAYCKRNPFLYELERTTKMRYLQFFQCLLFFPASQESQVVPETKEKKP